MKNLRYTAPLFIAFLLLASACTMPSASPMDEDAFNTLVAQTAQAQLTQVAAGAPPAGPAASTDEAAIRQALLAKLGWNDAELEFSTAANDGRIAYGSLKRAGEMQGAAWFAGKDAGGKWIIAHIGQGVPLCADIQPFNFPADWISHCVDASGSTIERSPGQPQPPAAGDVYAPDPLGPAYSSMWFAIGACYDMDILFTASDAACDVSLDANKIFVPQNGALFEGTALQSAPSLNTCKSAALGSAPVNPQNVTYICFKTNAGKYGFLLPREIRADGIVFDAYVFP